MISPKSEVGTHPVQRCCDFSGKVYIQRVDILGARVAHKKPRVIRRLAAPRSPDSEIAAQAAQTEEVLGTVSPNLNAVALGFSVAKLS